MVDVQMKQISRAEKQPLVRGSKTCMQHLPAWLLTKKMLLLMGTVLVLGGVAIVLWQTNVFDTDSSSSAPVVGAAAGSLQISVLPDVAPSSRRSSVNEFFRRSDATLREVMEHARRAYSDAGTEYDQFRSSVRTDVPGSDSLDTVNMIICFIGSNGAFAVDPSSAPYKAVVDMNRCQSNERSSEKQMYVVTVYDLASSTVVLSSTHTASTFTGHVGFKLNSNETELRAQISLAIHGTAVDEICPGVVMDMTAADTTKHCWVGGMNWQEGDLMGGYFSGSYDASNTDFPVGLTFFENDQNNGSSSVILRQDTSGAEVQAKIRKTFDSTSTYYCLNADATHARLFKSDTELASCVNSSVGGMCISRTDKTAYPFSFKLFDATTGAMATPTGVSSLNLQYTSASDKQCQAGISASGSYVGCGRGFPSTTDLFAEGASATSYDGTAYTLHHSNARVEELSIHSQTIAQFAAGSYMSYYRWSQSDSRFYNYILTPNGTSTRIFSVVYSRYNMGGGEWSNFTAGNTTVDVGTMDLQMQPCKLGAMWYTGTHKPSGQNQFAFVSGYREQIYDPVNGTVYFPVSNGILSSDVDVDLVCPSICTRVDQMSGNCYEYTKCPKTVHSGLTLGSQCTGAGCVTFDYATANDTAYVYKLESTDRQLYALQDNNGTTINATVVDATTGVTYDPMMQWSETVTSRMYEGTVATDLNTQAKIGAYMKTAGNKYYEVGIGMRGSYSGWSFNAKDTDENFVNLVDPLSCYVTMSPTTDANGGSAYTGQVLYLTFYEGHTDGLEFNQLSFGNTDMGSRQLHVPSPQIADGTLCTSAGGDTYRLKNDFKLVVPNEILVSNCSEWTTMISPGDLVTETIAPDNAATTTPVTTKTCVTDREFTNAVGCTYYPGMTST